MTEIYRCHDKDVLVAYLYGELDAVMRAHVERHMHQCEACTREVVGLQGLRSELGGWLPPEPELGFTITQKSARPPTAAVPDPWLWRSLPAWAQVAATLLVMAGGAALANVQVRYDAAGVTVSTGWMTPVSATMSAADTAVVEHAPPVPVTASGASEDWRPAFEALAAQLREGAAAAVPAAVGDGGSAGQSAFLRQVSDLIDESEQRQRQELARRLTQFGRDLEVQRRADLVRIEQNFGQVEGRAGAEMARQRELLMNYVRQASIRVPQ